MSITRSSPVQVAAFSTTFSQAPKLVSTSWSKISVGPSHVLAIKSNNTLWAWGINTNGQIGDGTTISRSSPVQLGNPGYTWNEAIAGINYSVGLRGDGLLFTWGLNSSGVLGDLNAGTTARSSPIQIGTSSWVAVSAGGTHVVAIRSDKSLWAWGLNTTGQLGTGDYLTRSSPVQVSSSSWIQISAGNTHTTAITSNGKLFTWGDNTVGTLGYTTPTQSYFSWTSIAGNVEYTVAIRNDGLLFAWGTNQFGQLGDGTTIPRSSPVQIGTSSWSVVTANALSGGGPTLAIRSDGTLWGWGFNATGVLGIGDTAYRSSPVQVSGGGSWITVSSGKSHTVAIKSDYKLYAWGLGTSGQLGDGLLNRSSPVQVGASSWTKVSAGDLSSYAIRLDGKLFAWGSNNSGQQGDGTTVNRSSPVQIGANSWNNVFAYGSNFVHAIDSNYKLFAWGVGGSGQLGYNDIISRSSPVQISSGNWSTLAVFSTAPTALAIQTDGSLWAWGLKTNLLLGEFSNASYTYSWSQVSAGPSHTAAIRSDGRLYTWGLNSSGQIGNDTRTNTSSPTLITTAPGHGGAGGAGEYWNRVSVNGLRTVAIRNDSTLWAWGNNAGYLLGDGTSTNRSRPVQIGVAYTGAAFSFNGSNQFLNTATNTSGNFTTGNFTIEFWAYPTINNRQDWLDLNDGTTRLLIYYSGTNIIYFATGAARITGSAMILNQWQHIAVSRESGFTRLFINGVQSGSTFADTINYPVQRLTIGKDGSGSTYVTGYMSNIRILRGVGLYTSNFSVPTSPLTLVSGSTSLLLTSSTTDSSGTLTITNNNSVGVITNLTPFFDSTSFTQISAGLSHSLAITSLGKLYAWGDDTLSQLGDGATVASRSQPVQIGTSSWSQISSYGNHSLGIDINNMLYGWGDNTLGQIGIGSSPLQYIFASTNYTVAIIRNDGVPYLVGLNNGGQIGDSSIVSRSSPVQISGGGSWSQIVSGWDASNNGYSVGIKTNGTLYTWGRNSGGVLGDSALSTTVTRSSPVQVGTNSWISVSTNNNNILAIRSDYTLWAWGTNASGDLGLGDKVARSSPVQVGTSSWIAVSVGFDTSMGLRIDGSLFSWGNGIWGQIGDNTTVSKSSPVQIGIGNSYLQISSNPHKFAIRIDGTLWGWGRNDVGQVGDNTQTYRSSPVQVDSDNRYDSISTGFDISVGKRKNGTIWSWGYNNGGQLGDNSTINRFSPVQIGTSSWVSISAGYESMFGITVSGINGLQNVYSWGYNNFGQLGLNDRANRSSPTQVGTTQLNQYVSSPTQIGTSSWTTISAGLSNSFAIRSDYKLFSWGDNSQLQSGYITPATILGTGSNPNNNAQSYIRNTDNALIVWGINSSGEIGDGTTINRSSPVQLGLGLGYSQFAKIARAKVANLVYTLGVKTDGTLWSWGSNTGGQLGIGLTTSRSSPVQVGTLSNWSDVAAGPSHALAIKTDGSLWGWGLNTSGQAGVLSWAKVSSGSSHTLAIRSDGQLYGWGSNTVGQVGDITIANRSSPVQIGTGFSWNNVSAGINTSAAIRGDYLLFTWGLNSSGALGLSDTANRSSPTQLGTAFTALRWIQISARDYMAGLTTDNRLFTWGSNTGYKLGNGTTVPRSSPVQVGTSSYISVSTGDSFMSAIRIDGGLFIWGTNTSGQLGLGDVALRSQPTQIGSSSWSVVSASNNAHALAVTIDGALFSWGNNLFGQLGLGDVINRSSPVQVNAGTSYTNVYTGTNYSLALKNDNTLWGWGDGTRGTIPVVNPLSWINLNSSTGIHSDYTLWVWGDNSAGQLGISSTQYRSSPVQIGTTSWTATSMSLSNVFAIKSDGSLWAWGANASGQLGLNDTVNRSSPIQLGASSWTKISTGGAGHTLAITTTGTLYAWGLNNAGQLGDGTSVNKSSPVQIGSSSWTAVSAGFSFSTAIRTDGGLFTWGFGTQGQLGSGLTTARSSPVQVGTSSWTQVSAGDSHAVATRSDSKLFAWGLNNNGQVGDSTILSRSSPVQVGTSSWSQISAGISTVAAITITGGLFTWGLGTNGQLGSAATTSRSAPVQLGTSSWTTVSAGKDAMFAVDKVNRLFSWGINNLGQLGLGDTASRSSPVQIGTNIQTSFSNPTQIGGSAVSTNSSVFFNSVTSDYLIVNNSSGFNIASNSSNYTIEAWIYTTTTGAIRTIVAKDWISGNYPSWGLSLTASGMLEFDIGSGIASAVGYQLISGTKTVDVNAWTHVAVVITGNTSCKMYVNGTLDVTTAITGTQGLGSNNILIGQNGQSIQYFNGYISNLRITKSLVYTANFIPSTSPFTTSSQGVSSANVGLLTLQNSTLIDNSPNGYTLKTVGSPLLTDTSYTQVSAGESNFAVVGFIGTLFIAGDNTTGQLGNSTTVARTIPIPIAYPSLYDNRSSPAQIGTGSWSQIAAGLNYSVALKSDGTLYTWGDNTVGYLGDGTTFTRRSMTQIGTNSYTSISSGGSHAVALRTDLTLYAWGLNNAGQLGDNSTINRSSPVQVNTALVTSWNAISAGASHTVAIEATNNLPYGWGLNSAGQIGDLTTANRSSPVQVRIPSSTNNSYQFNGSDSLTVASSSAFDLSTSDFTVECWVYLNGSNNTRGFFAAGNSSRSGIGYQISGSGRLQVIYGNGSDCSFVTGTNALQLNTWIHVATSRVGSNARVYINGTLEITVTSSNFGAGSYSCFVGIGYGISGGNLTLGSPILGYISNFRLIKGTGLYTTGFYPSAGALTTTSQGAIASQVSLLTAQSSNIIDNSTNAFAITNTGTVTASSINPFGPYYSASFNGTTQFLTISDATALNLGTGNFTIECWVYTGSYYNGTSYAGIFDSRTSGASAGGISLYYQANTTNLVFRVAGTNIMTTPASNTPLNTWNHIAVVRSGSTNTLYVNGSSVSTATNSDTHSLTSYWIGKTFDPFYFNGYISNFRIVKGTAVYTGNFTVPTNILRTTQSASTNIVALTGTETSLLTLQSSSIVDNSATPLTITNNGTVTVITAYAPFSASTAGSTITWDSIIAGVTSTMGTSNNTLFTWGAGTTGQLGDSTTVNKLAPTATGVGSIWSVAEKLFSSPVQVGTSKSWSLISTGGSHAVATATDNTVWGWGQNNIGQLGDNTTIGKSSPTQIESNTSNYTSITAGVSNTFAIRSTTSLLFAWGQNNVGQIGDASTVAGRSSPVQIFAGTMTSPLIPIKLSTVSGSSYTQVQAGSAASVIDSIGRLFTWGTNTNGQVGDNTVISRSSPIQLGGIQFIYINSPIQVGAGSWSQVSAGSSHTLAIDSNSLLYAWGKTPANGQSVNRSSPVQIGTNSWLNVSTGNDMSLATDTTKTLYAWGLNTNYQLGSPNFYLNQSVTSPVAIGTLAIVQSETTSGGAGNGGFIKNI